MCIRDRALLDVHRKGRPRPCWGTSVHQRGGRQHGWWQGEEAAPLRPGPAPVLQPTCHRRRRAWQRRPP
eukprot:6251827-Alexandrium_andersonii.AAC.1